MSSRSTTLSLILSLLVVLISCASNTVNAIFHEDQCNACVAKGCGFCYRKSKTSSFYKEVCICDWDKFEYGAICNDVSMIKDGKDYGKQAYSYYNNNNYRNNYYNNNNANNNNNNNNNYAQYNNNDDDKYGSNFYNNNNNAAQQYYEESLRYAADDDHFEKNLSGEYNYRKAKNNAQCIYQARPEAAKATIAVVSIVGIVALLFGIFYLYQIHRPKPALKKTLIDNEVYVHEQEIPPAVL